VAKDLPYFKFSVSEWNDGDITLCSMAAQGLFINLCSLYWSQEGNLSLTKSQRRFKDCNTAVWQELISERIIKVSEDKIIISFLDQQFVERKKLSAINSENVKKRWEKDNIDTVVLPSNNDSNEPVYNIEEKREEEKRKEKKRIEKPLRGYDVPFVNGCLKAWEEWEQYMKEKKKKLTPSTAKKQIKFLGGRPENEIIEIINRSIEKGWQGLFEINNNGNNFRTTSQSIRRADAVIETGKTFGNL